MCQGIKRIKWCGLYFNTLISNTTISVSHVLNRMVIASKLHSYTTASSSVALLTSRSNAPVKSCLRSRPWCIPRISCCKTYSAISQWKDSSRWRDNTCASIQYLCTCLINSQASWKSWQCRSWPSRTSSSKLANASASKRTDRIWTSSSMIHAGTTSFLPCKHWWYEPLR